MSTKVVTQDDFWRDFATRIVGPAVADAIAEIFVQKFVDMLLNMPLSRLPSEFRATARSIREARQRELQNLIPDEIRGPAMRGAYLKGIEAAVQGDSLNPYKDARSEMTRRMRTYWAAGHTVGTSWRTARR